MFRYRLRTLLIALALVPPIIGLAFAKWARRHSEIQSAHQALLARYGPNSDYDLWEMAICDIKFFEMARRSSEKAEAEWADYRVAASRGSD
jgi:hypothetical protein